MGKINVAQYLIARMRQLGVKQMFGVAGNYTAPLLNIIHEGDHKIQIVRNANEQVAAFAADGYARLNGTSVVYVTYSVGAFSAINAIAGSYTEKVPVLIINGAPTNKEYSIERNAGLTYAHTTGDMVPDIEMYRNITVAAERITNAEQARYQIDSALTAMITYKRPVYLEITEDVWRKEFIEEVDLSVLPKLASGEGAYITKSDMDNAIMAVFEKLLVNRKIVFWAGVELQRKGIQNDFLSFMEIINKGRERENFIKFITTPMSKSVISEENKYFEGCLTLNKDKVNDLVGQDGLIIGFGAWTIGKDNGNQNIRSEQTILASHGGLWVGAKFFPLIDLKSFINRFQEEYLPRMSNGLLDEQLKVLTKVLGKRNLLNNETSQPFKTYFDDLKPLEVFNTYLNQKECNCVGLTYDTFVSIIGSFTKDKPVVVDAGFPLIASQSLKIPNQSHFIAQASWLSIGYSLGALTGVSAAYPNSRAVCIVGDGAFQETCQAISDQITLGQNNVIFVLVNGIYGIEQEIVDPTPFIDKNENEFHAYNILPKWDYVKFNESLGGKGIKVESTKKLIEALKLISDDLLSHYLVEIHVPSTNVPCITRAKHDERKNKKTVGEDEYLNENWPSIGVY